MLSCFKCVLPFPLMKYLWKYVMDMSCLSTTHSQVQVCLANSWQQHTGCTFFPDNFTPSKMHEYKSISCYVLFLFLSLPKVPTIPYSMYIVTRGKNQSRNILQRNVGILHGKHIVENISNGGGRLRFFNTNRRRKSVNLGFGEPDNFEF